MSWNYRIVQYANGSGFGLHEVHYDADGHPHSMTSDPTGFVGDTPGDIQGALMVARLDANRRPVFKEPENWSE